MFAKIAEILDELKIDNATLKKVRERVANSLGDSDKIRVLIDELCQQHKLPSCQNFDNLAFCSVILGAAYFSLDEYEQAIKRFESASNQFCIQGDTWNQSIALKFLGLVYLQIGKQNPAIEAFEKAQLSLKQERRIHRNDYTHRYDEPITELDGLIENARLGASAKPNPIPTSRPSQKQPQTKQTWPTARITYSIHDFGHASRVGKYVLDDEPISEIATEEININGEQYRIYCSQEGSHELTLTAGNEYQWLCVAGESMNLANPTAIEPGDYILADLNRNVNIGDIVIASLLNPPTPAERAGVIKRFAGSELRSESRLKIESIPIAEAKVRGVVIAIAKPVES